MLSLIYIRAKILQHRNEYKDTTRAARMLLKLMLYPLEHYESGNVDY